MFKANSFINNNPISTIEPLPFPSNSCYSSGSNILISTIVTMDVNIKVDKIMTVDLLCLGLSCSCSNSKAWRSMGQVNGMLQRIYIYETWKMNVPTTAISMPSLPTNKSLGLYNSLKFSQTIVLSTSSIPFYVLLDQFQSLVIDSLLEQGFRSEYAKMISIKSLYLLGYF